MPVVSLNVGILKDINVLSALPPNYIIDWCLAVPIGYIYIGPYERPISDHIYIYNVYLRNGI